jgi:hypothetical protein
VTVRPQQVTRGKDGRSYQRELTDQEAVEVLRDKISYAKARWGATLFYIDSNHFADQADAFRKLSEVHADVLLIPEHKSIRSWAHAVPYNELRKGTTSTPELARATYPRSASVIVIDDVKDLSTYFDELVKSVKAGDILMMNAWYKNPSLEVARDIYNAADR